MSEPTNLAEEKERRDRVRDAGLIEEGDMPFSRTQCWRLRKSGRLKSYRVGRRIFYDRRHLEQLLAESEAA